MADGKHYAYSEHTPMGQAERLAEAHNVLLDDCFGPGRRGSLVTRVRHAVMRWMQDREYTQAEIAEFLGVHHTTVSSALRRGDDP